VKLIPDRPGHFPERPQYQIEELEDERKRIITSFLERRYGQMVIPVPTIALKMLIEAEAAKLLKAELSHEGEEVHSISEFFPRRKPWVSITYGFSAQPWCESQEHTMLYDRY